jgi:hypothetical protein
LNYEVQTLDNSIKYVLPQINKDEVVYGNILSDRSLSASIDVNGVYTQDYSCWLSPSVFDIPADSSAAYVTISAQDLSGNITPQFYTCNLDLMYKVCDMIKKNKADVNTISDDKIQVVTKPCKEGDALIISLPFNKGWTVKLNGNKTIYDSFANGFLEITMESGENVIDLQYQIPGLKSGIGITIISIIMLILTEIILKKERIKR